MHGNVQCDHPDQLLHNVGVFKERLSQSALYYESLQVTNSEAEAVYSWLKKRGMKFHTGKTHETDLTDDQILAQCKAYIAAVRIADDFGCDTIGIQYQQGLKDLMPASDLIEGTLNNLIARPSSRATGNVCCTRINCFHTLTKSMSARGSMV